MKKNHQFKKISSLVLIFLFFLTTKVQAQSQCPTITDNGSNSITLSYSTALSGTITQVEITTSSGTAIYNSTKISTPSTTQVTIPNLGDPSSGVTTITSTQTATNITTTGTSVEICATSTPLPVKLVSFTGTVFSEEVVQLNWKTASEINNEKFEVEAKMGDGWTKIATVPGNGTTQMIKSYSINVVATPEGIYRLKQVDYNGVYEYSREIIVNKEMSPFVVRVYPNPTSSGDLTVKFLNTDEQKFQIKVIEITGGKIVQEIETSGDRIMVNTNSLPNSGAYLVQIKNTETRVVVYARIVKN